MSENLLQGTIMYRQLYRGEVQGMRRCRLAHSREALIRESIAVSGPGQLQTGSMSTLDGLHETSCNRFRTRNRRPHNDGVGAVIESPLHLFGLTDMPFDNHRYAQPRYQLLHQFPV